MSLPVPLNIRGGCFIVGKSPRQVATIAVRINFEVLFVSLVLPRHSFFSNGVHRIELKREEEKGGRKIVVLLREALIDLLRQPASIRADGFGHS